MANLASYKMSNGIASTQNPFYSVGGFTDLLYDNLPVKRVSLPATTATYNLTANSDNRIIVALPTMTVNCTVILPPVASSVGQVFTVVLDGDLNGIHTVFLRCNGAETVLCGQIQNRFRQFNVQSVDLTSRARAGTFIQAISDGTKWIYTGNSTHDLSYQLDPGNFPQVLSSQDSGMRYYIETVPVGGTTITLPPIAGNNGFTITYYIEATLGFDITVQCSGGSLLMNTALVDKKAGEKTAEINSAVNTASFTVNDTAGAGTWFTCYCNGERWFATGVSPQVGAWVV